MQHCVANNRSSSPHDAETWEPERWEAPNLETTIQRRHDRTRSNKRCSSQDALGLDLVSMAHTVSRDLTTMMYPDTRQSTLAQNLRLMTWRLGTARCWTTETVYVVMETISGDALFLSARAKHATTVPILDRNITTLLFKVLHCTALNTCCILQQSSLHPL